MNIKLGLSLCLIFGSFGFSFSEPDCTVNGTYTECPTSCPETCKAKNRLCTRDCGGPCVCKEGYIIDNSIPACVLRTDCPAGVIQSDDDSETEFVDNFPYFGKS